MTVHKSQGSEYRAVVLALGRGAPRGEGIALAPAIALAALTVVLLPLWAGR